MKYVLSLTILIFLFVEGELYSQDVDVPKFSQNSIRTGLGIGINGGLDETGFGLVYSIGWQKSYGKKNKLRLNPNLLFGGFTDIGITDISDQYVRISSLGFNAHYDLIKYKSVSIVTTAGVFLNYSKGLIGSAYFSRLYYGGSASIALRINPKKSRVAYEWRHISVQGGNKDFFLAYFMLGIDVKLKK